MTSKKDPPKPGSDGPPPAEGPLAGQPLDVILQVLANAVGQVRGLQSGDLLKHVTAVTGQVQSLVNKLEVRVQDEQARKKAAEEVERLVDMFVRAGTAAGKALGGFREPVMKAFEGVELGKMAEGLRLLADWMQNPSSETEAQVKELVASLEKTMADRGRPSAEDEDRRAALKADVKASLDQIFRGKRNPYTFEPAAPPAAPAPSDPDKKKPS